jgi:hypothetical protein
MRTALALAAAGALVALGPSSSSARPPQLAGPQANGEEATIQSVDWYCGPRCQSWHHRRWEERHQQSHYQQPYGYYHPHRYSQYGYGYGRGYGY